MALTVKLTHHTDNPMQAMMDAASRCYNTEPSETVVKKCFERGHMAIAEYASFQFEIRGVSRVTTHQIVRKRYSSFAQQSHRVKDDDISFVVPPSINQSDATLLEYLDFVHNARMFYERLIRKYNIPPEDARYVLPSGLCSVIEQGINARSLIELAHQRLCNRAQWEIREVVSRMKSLVADVCPLVANHMVPKCSFLDTCPEENDTCTNYPNT